MYSLNRDDVLTYGKYLRNIFFIHLFPTYFLNWTAPWWPIHLVSSIGGSPENRRYSYDTAMRSLLKEVKV